MVVPMGAGRFEGHPKEIANNTTHKEGEKNPQDYFRQLRHSGLDAALIIGGQYRDVT
jgi:hypothetical protein